MAEAIDALHALETQRLDEAEAALRDAREALDATEAALTAAELAVLAHDEAERLARDAETTRGARTADSFAREDAHRRAMRTERVLLVEKAVRALAAREASAEALEACQRVLAETRARARAIDARIEVREASRQRAAEQKLEDEADDRRRR